MGAGTYTAVTPQPRLKKCLKMTDGLSAMPESRITNEQGPLLERMQNVLCACKNRTP